MLININYYLILLISVTILINFKFLQTLIILPKFSYF